MIWTRRRARRSIAWLRVAASHNCRSLTTCWSPAGPRDENGDAVEELRKLRVYEFSFVPVGANQDTSVVAVKALAEDLAAKAGRVLSAKNESALREARDSIDSVLSSLSDGDEEKSAHPGGSDQDAASGTTTEVKSGASDEAEGKSPVSDEDQGALRPSRAWRPFSISTPPHMRWRRGLRMDLQAQRAAAIKAAQDIIKAAEGRDLSEAEVAELQQKQAEVESSTEQIERAQKSAELIAAFDRLGAGPEGAGVRTTTRRSRWVSTSRSRSPGSTWRR